MKNKAIVIMGIILIFISLFYNSCFAENFGYIDNKDSQPFRLVFK